MVLRLLVQLRFQLKIRALCGMRALICAGNKNSGDSRRESRQPRPQRAQSGPFAKRGRERKKERDGGEDVEHSGAGRGEETACAGGGAAALPAAAGKQRTAGSAATIRRSGLRGAIRFHTCAAFRTVIGANVEVQKHDPAGTDPGCNASISCGTPPSRSEKRRNNKAGRTACAAAAVGQLGMHTDIGGEES